VEFKDKAMTALALENLVMFHNIAPQSRSGEAMIQRLAQRFGLGVLELELLRNDRPIVVKRHQNPMLAQKLCEALVALGAISWVQYYKSHKDYEDRRGQPRRDHDDRRDAWRKNAVVSERRCCQGRRRQEQNQFIAYS